MATVKQNLQEEIEALKVELDAVRGRKSGKYLHMYKDKDGRIGYATNLSADEMFGFLEFAGLQVRCDLIESWTKLGLLSR